MNRKIRQIKNYYHFPRVFLKVLLERKSSSKREFSQRHIRYSKKVTRIHRCTLCLTNLISVFRNLTLPGVLFLFHQKSFLVQRTLEYESDKTSVSPERVDAERAGGVECVGAVRQRDLTPVRCRLLRTDVAAGDEGVSGALGVYVEGRFAAQPQRHVGPLRSAHGTLPLLALRLHLGRPPASPAVVAVDMSAAQVCPRLLLIQHVLASHAGEGQGVEADGALGPAGVELLPQRLQVFDRGSASEALCCTPQEGGAAEVNQGAINQLVALRIHLQNAKI